MLLLEKEDVVFLLSLLFDATATACFLLLLLILYALLVLSRGELQL